MVLTFLDDFINPCRKKLESLGYVLDNFTIHGHDSIMAQKASLKQLVACLKVLECGFHMYLVTWGVWWMWAYNSDSTCSCYMFSSGINTCKHNKIMKKLPAWFWQEQHLVLSKNPLTCMPPLVLEPCVRILYLVFHTLDTIDPQLLAIQIWHHLVWNFYYFFVWKSKEH